MDATFSPKIVSGLVLGGIALGVVLLAIGIGLFAHAAWQKKKATVPMTAEELKKHEQKRKWGIALMVIGGVLGAGAGVAAYMRRDQMDLRSIFNSSPALAM